MIFTVERNWVEVVGHIWQPGIGLCAMRYDLRAADLAKIGEPTRAAVEIWLGGNSGDFQEVLDFRAIVGEVEIPWADESHEAAYSDAMGCCI